MNTLITFSLILTKIDPIITHVPYLNWPITWYGFLFGIGYLSGVYTFNHLLSKEKDKTSYLLFAKKLEKFFLLSFLFGARIGQIIIYGLDGNSVFNLLNGGLCGQTGLFCAIGLSIIYKNYFFKKLDHLVILDSIAISVLPCAILVRIANLINCEIIGKKTNFFIHLIFPDGSKRHPASLYEAVSYFLIFIIFHLNGSKKRGFAFLFISIAGSISRFFIDFLKEPIDQEKIFFISLSQVISILYVSFCLYAILNNKFRK